MVLWRTRSLVLTLVYTQGLTLTSPERCQWTQKNRAPLGLLRRCWVELLNPDPRHAPPSHARAPRYNHSRWDPALAMKPLTPAPPPLRERIGGFSTHMGVNKACPTPDARRRRLCIVHRRLPRAFVALSATHGRVCEWPFPWNFPQDPISVARPSLSRGRPQPVKDVWRSAAATSFPMKAVPA